MPKGEIEFNAESDATVYCFGEIDLGLCLYLNQSLIKAAVGPKWSDGKRHINLIITSGGGQMWAGMSIIDAIKMAQLRGVEVHGRVHGFAGSMAAYIFQVCDTRSMSPTSQLMLHGWEEGKNEGMDKKKRSAHDKSIHNMENQLRTMMLDRTKLDEAKLDEILEDSSYKYFTAEESLEAGLVDEVCH